MRIEKLPDGWSPHPLPQKNFSVFFDFSFTAQPSTTFLANPSQIGFKTKANLANLRNVA